MGDLNARIGSQRLGNITGTIGEPTVNSHKKLTDFYSFNKFRTMNKYFMHKDSHKLMWQPRYTKSIRDCKLQTIK
jgi:hypothetical protein